MMSSSADRETGRDSGGKLSQPELKVPLIPTLNLTSRFSSRDNWSGRKSSRYSEQLRTGKECAC